jgi:hypothetical protein
MASRTTAALICLPFLGACSVPPKEPDFESIDPVETTMAIEQASTTRDLTKVDELVAQLDSSDPAIRLVAIAALRDLTGQDLGYNPSDKESDRLAATQRWEDWIKAERAAGRLPQDPSSGVSAGNGRQKAPSAL